MQANSTAGEDPISSINVTPLVDVALVLVIVFMITLPCLMEQSMKVQNSSEKVVPLSSANNPILVELSKSDITVEGKKVPLRELSATLRGLIARRGVSRVALAADRAVAHGRVVEVLDEAMSSGAKDVNILEPKEEIHGPS